MAQRPVANLALLHQEKQRIITEKAIGVPLCRQLCDFAQEGCKAHFRVRHNTLHWYLWYLLLVAVPEHVFGPHAPLRHGMRFEPAFEGETSARSRRSVGRRSVLARRF